MNLNLEEYSDVPPSASSGHNHKELSGSIVLNSYSRRNTELFLFEVTGLCGNQPPVKPFRLTQSQRHPRTKAEPEFCVRFKNAATLYRRKGLVND